MKRIALIVCVLTGAALFEVRDAGPSQPLIVRQVVLDGIEGAGYYSAVEQGYRFVQDQPTVVTDLVEEADFTQSDDAIAGRMAGTAGPQPDGSQTDGLMAN